MSYTPTPFLNIDVPVPGSGQQYSVQKYVDAIVALDAELQSVDTALTLHGGRLTTAEGKITALEAGVGRSTLTRFQVTDPAALDALSTAKIGDVAWMTTPGTGIDAMAWEAVADTGANLDWRPQGPIYAATKANLDAFIAVIAGTSDLRFQVGANAFVRGTGITYIFSSVTGNLLLASNALRKKPSGASTGVTISDTGYMTSTAQATIRFDGAFDDSCDIYDVHYDFTVNNAVSLQAQLTKATVAATTLYDNIRWRVTNSAGAASAPVIAGPAMILSDGLGVAASRHVGKIRLWNPKVVAPSIFRVEQSLQTIPVVAATAAEIRVDGNHNTADSYDGLLFSLGAGGTITVNSLYIEGLPK